MDSNTLHGCGHSPCSGNCRGCSKELELTQMEVNLLRLFAQIPFLPVAQRQESGPPLFMGDSIGPAEILGPVITALQQKQLSQLDYDLPLANYSYSDYEPCIRKGSMALTAKGQTVVELLEIQGIEA